MTMVRLACHAMATRFELLLAGAAPAELRAAGEEAVALIHALDAQLSCHDPRSDISRINTHAAAHTVRVEGELFRLLLRAQALSGMTGGAFDPTVGPLMQAWRRAAATGEAPKAGELAAVRARTGMHLVELDVVRSTVRFPHPGMALDLGAIAKGHALERAAATLRELGVTSALLHGGTSSVQAIGVPPEGGRWSVAIEDPGGAEAPPEERTLAVVELRDEALSVSAGHGRRFRCGDADYGHVLDPRTGVPAEAAQLAAVACASGTDADALSTALLVRGEAPAGVPGLRTLVLAARGVSAQGIQLQRGRRRPLQVKT